MTFKAPLRGGRGSSASKADDAITAFFVGEPDHGVEALWTDGFTLWSYKTPIARKSSPGARSYGADAWTVYVNVTKYSTTTSRYQNHLLKRLQTSPRKWIVVRVDNVPQATTLDQFQALADSAERASRTVSDTTPAHRYVDEPGRIEEVLSLVGRRKVRVSRTGVALFNARWPNSTLRDSRAYWFEFDAKGDLIDTDVPEQDDGPAATALAEDAREWLENGTTPDWWAL